jgi:hypothetical protein
MCPVLLISYLLIGKFIPNLPNLYLLGHFSESNSAFGDLEYWNCCSPYNWASSKRKMIFVGQFVTEICDFVCQISAFRLTPIYIRNLQFRKSVVRSVDFYPWAEYGLELIILHSFLFPKPNQAYSLTENGVTTQSIWYISNENCWKNSFRT